MSATLVDLQWPVGSRDYVRVSVTDANGNDPTTNPVWMAFPTTGTDPTTFYTGSWTTISGVYYALCLIGPGGGQVALAKGFYDVYVQTQVGAALPQLFSGTMEVY